MSNAKIRFYDTENLMCKAYVWGPGKQYVRPASIFQHRALICGSWKDYGDDTLYHTPFVQFDKYYEPNDYNVIASLVQYLGEADMIVAHNGDSFDLKMINARAVYHGIDPVPPIPTIDTYKVAKKHFRFESNRLDDLGEFLGVGRKREVDYDLWKACMYGDRSALREMLEYNLEDVVLLEKVYLKLRPFITSHPNLGVLAGALDTCPNCGTTGGLVRNGTRLVGRVSIKQRYHCTHCGCYPSGPAQRIKTEEGEFVQLR